MELIESVIPGFIFLFIYKTLRDTKEQSYEITLLGSIALSYLFIILSSTITNIIPAVEEYQSLITVLLSIISALLFVKYQSSDYYHNHMIKIGHMTGSENIWHDFFNSKKGARIKFFTQYQFQDVTIVGDIAYFEKINDNECLFAIKNYTIKTKDNKSYSCSGDQNVMIFNTKDIHGLESHHSQ